VDLVEQAVQVAITDQQEFLVQAAQVAQAAQTAQMAFMALLE
jgi:hypothetical protein